ncbi:MAG: hypothetical protein J0H43_15415, partial [Actinobacteria bacterium]|nr:hypothetical protein [Actinomycetota bacterium]
TPGLDECSWQLTRSAAGASANVVIYLPPDQSRGGYDRGHRAARHTVTLHGIGAAAYYDPTTQTLVVQTAHHVAGIQVVTPVTSSHRAIHLQQHMETLAATIAGHLG